jgi:hypothetical protein
VGSVVGGDGRYIGGVIAAGYDDAEASQVGGELCVVMSLLLLLLLLLIAAAACPPHACPLP